MDQKDNLENASRNCIYNLLW